MLTHLRLQNFKSWRDTGDIALRPITAIYGANSSGKSALIQALLLLKQTAEATDRNLTLHFGSPNSLVDLGDFSSVVHQHDTSVAIELSLAWEPQEPLTLGESAADIISPCVGFSVRADLCNESAVEPQEITYRLGEAEFGMSRRPDPRRFNLIASGSTFQFEQNLQFPPLAGVSRPIKCYGFPDDTRLFYRNADFLPKLAHALEERLSGIHYLGPLRASPQREYRWSGASPTDVGRVGEAAVDALIGSRQNSTDRKLEEQISEAFSEVGLLHKFGIEQIAGNLYQVKVKQSETGPEALITDVGFGVSQILPVLVLCFYAPRGSTIILEQPEIHLHPAAQSALGDVLIAARKRRDVQIIVESHSEHLLRRLQRRIAEEDLPQNDLGVYFCKNNGAESKLTTLELDPYGNIKNWPEHFFGDEFGEMAAMTEAAIERRATDAAG